MSLLGERLLAVDSALAESRIPHAFGGAIALAFCTAEPRATIHIDVNIWLGLDDVDHVLDVLPQGVRVTKSGRAKARREGQVRLMWDDTPVDLFFAVHDFHRQIASETRDVVFEGRTISVLACDALVVFKAIFNRTRDWADIEAAIKARTVSRERSLDRLVALLGPGDPAVLRLRALVEP